MLDLGRAIVQQLEGDTRGELLSRWMAHHLAELMEIGENSEGAASDTAKQQAAELIIKLWANRRSLPAPADPLSGLAASIEVLAAMQPAANPWARYRRTQSQDDLLQEMFGVLTQIVMGGLMLTRPCEIRAVTDAEQEALTDEERFLIDQLGRWKKLLVTRTTDDLDLAAFYATFMDDDVDIDLVETGILDKTEQGGPAHEDQRRVILSNLETFQTKLAALVERFRMSLDPSRDVDKEELDE